jgi:hypothetical protein
MKCPRCQQDNPAYARFCLGCGARLAVACTNLPAGAEILASLEARYPTHEEEQVETKGWAASGYPPPRGIWVALATFIPTFLAVFIGVPVLLGSAPARHAAEPRATTMTVTASPAPTVRTAEVQPMFLDTSGPAGTEKRRGGPPTLVVEASSPPPNPETTELAVGPKSAPSPKPTAIEPTPPKPARAKDISWVPAAAFADNQAAARLASSMRNQGYRVEVRHEDSATHPWAVWIWR